MSGRCSLRRKAPTRSFPSHFGQRETSGRVLVQRKRIQAITIFSYGTRVRGTVKLHSYLCNIGSLYRTFWVGHAYRVATAMERFANQVQQRRRHLRTVPLNGRRDE